MDCEDIRCDSYKLFSCIVLGSLNAADSKAVIDEPFPFLVLDVIYI